MPVIATRNSAAPQGSYDPAKLQLPSFVTAVARFRDGSDTPRAFLERCLETISARDTEVQAFVCVNERTARIAADASTGRYRCARPLSPIDGCPIGVKDMIETIDMPTRMNSPIYEGFTSLRDAACIHALRKGGAVILGKTWMPELAMGKSGPTRNPFDLARTPGGSSSGSGACVGAGMVPVAIGNQTGGSLIRPSSYNGIYGFKPTHGALNVGGVFPIAPSQDHIGPMAATLADAWLTAQQISERAGGSSGHPGLTGTAELPAPIKPQRLVHLRTLGWRELDAGSLQAFEMFLSRLRAAGVEVASESDSADIAALERLLEDASAISNDIIMYEARWPLLADLDARPGSIGDRVMERLARGIEMAPADYRAALQRRDRIRHKVAEVASGASCFVTLASSGPAPTGHGDTGSRAFLSPWSMVGGPSFSLPLLSVDQMPLGIQLMAIPDCDERLTGIAHWICRLLQV